MRMGAKRIVPAILISVFFFHGWLQLPNGYDFREALNAEGSTSSVFIVGPHHHSSKATFPLFENNRILIANGVGDLFFLHHGRYFLCFTCNEFDYIPKLSQSDNLSAEVVIFDKVTGIYRLRAPPALSTFS